MELKEYFMAPRHPCHPCFLRNPRYPCQNHNPRHVYGPSHPCDPRQKFDPNHFYGPTLLTPPTPKFLEPIPPTSLTHPRTHVIHAIYQTLNKITRTFIVMQFCDGKLKNKEVKFFKYYELYSKIMFILDVIKTKYTFHPFWICYLRAESFSNTSSYFKQRT